MLEKIKEAKKHMAAAPRYQGTLSLEESGLKIFIDIVNTMNFLNSKSEETFVEEEVLRLSHINQTEPSLYMFTLRHSSQQAYSSFLLAETKIFSISSSPAILSQVLIPTGRVKIAYRFPLNPISS